MLERVGTYYYFFPTYAQGRKVLWNGTDRDGQRWVGHYLPHELVKRRNETDMFIELVNGSMLQVIGLDKFTKDTIVGTNVVGCVYSEYAIQDPMGRLYMLPIIAENGGWEILNFTPRGENHAKRDFDTAVRMMEEDGSWYASLLTVDDTKIPGIHDEIEFLRRSGVPEEVIQQEFWCSFTAMLSGSYFGPYLDRARSDKRITIVPYDSNLPVHTAWDIGVNDPTAIWFFQKDAGGAIRFIRYYEHGRRQGETGLDVHIAYLDSLGYTYGTHLAPHDIGIKEWGTGQTRYERALEKGLEFTVVEKLAKDEQIAAAQGLFSKFVFDEIACKQGLHALTHYEEQYDEKLGVHKGRPLHNWASHGADALQTLAVGIDLVSNDIFHEHVHAPPRYANTAFNIWSS